MRTKHQYALQSEKLPFMLVRTSKVIEMRFRDWPNERGYVRVKSQTGVKQPGTLFDPSTQFRDNKSSRTPDGPFVELNMAVLASN